MSKKPAVFVDRDRTLNEMVYDETHGILDSPRIPEQVKLRPGAAAFLKAAKARGFLVVVVTNQPDLSTGRQSRSTLDALHAGLLRELAIDAIKVCPHTDVARCACRKPAPGLILESAEELDIDLSRSFMVGDRWRDMAAGQAAGCKQVFFIDYGYLEQRPIAPFTVVTSLASAVELIIDQG
jgi:D-glycero-D-manno-heptose 1,7-bisphosphate phosphatase